MSFALRLSAFALFIVMSLPHLGVAADQGSDSANQNSSADMAATEDWPRDIKSDGQEITIYQPQIEKWTDNKLEQRAAVSVKIKAASEPTFGVIWMTARTEVDKENHMVALEDVKITKANFPSEPDKNDSFLESIRKQAPATLRPISLERLQASLAITKAESGSASTDVKNETPQIIYSSTPAILVLVDGKPVLRETGTKDIERVINSRALIVFSKADGKYYFYLGDRWMVGSSDPEDKKNTWSVAPKFSPDMADALTQVKQAADADKQVDLLNDPESPLMAELKKDNVPTVYMSTVPTELIQTQGKAAFEPVADTQILYVKNSSDSLFLNTPDQHYYANLGGRWYKSKSLDGSWDYVAAKKLPADFAKIPENHPKGDVLASVPGTPQAQEAVISNQVPQTATVDRNETKLSVQYDGDPQFKDIDGTDLQYAPNTAVPVIKVNPSSYYAVQNGVWFSGPSAMGPWSVATEVPTAIYKIPARHPLHYVSYVYVYGSTPDVVYTGYLPGYMGSYVSPDGVVVYGTGYNYHPWIGSVWYGAPLTFGFGPVWSLGFGWGFHAGFFGGVAFGGPLFGPWWGPWHGWAPVGGWHQRVGYRAFTNHANFYHGWGHGVVSNPGFNHGARFAAGGHGPQIRGGGVHGEGLHGEAVHGGGGRNNIYADHGGNVFRQNNGNWEKYGGKEGWSAKSAPKEVEHEQEARARGQQRVSQFRNSGFSGGTHVAKPSTHSGGGGGHHR